jgi:hypothetical protein
MTPTPEQIEDAEGAEFYRWTQEALRRPRRWTRTGPSSTTPLLDGLEDD